jgi:hypothetical protein
VIQPVGTVTVSERERRLRIFEADGGRGFGWFVEKDGRRLAALSDPRFEDMFWYSYDVEPLGETDAERAAVFTKELWHQPGLVYRNRVTGEVAPHAFPGGGVPTKGAPRIWMRALYTSLTPTMLERVLLWFRGWKRTRARNRGAIAP